MAKGGDALVVTKSVVTSLAEAILTGRLCQKLGLQDVGGKSIRRRGDVGDRISWLQQRAKMVDDCLTQKPVARTDAKACKVDARVAAPTHNAGAESGTIV